MSYFKDKRGLAFYFERMCKHFTKNESTPLCKYTVYGLKLNGSFFYVGSTRKPKQRELAHRTTYGNDFEFVELCHFLAKTRMTSYKYLSVDYERMWINKLIKQGHPLKNRMKVEKEELLSDYIN